MRFLKLNRKNKEDRENKIMTAVLITAMIIISGFLIVSSWKISQKREQLTKRIDELKNEIAKLENENEGLKSGLSAVSNPEALEEKMREEGYQKPGEKVVVVKREETDTTQETEISNPNLWQKILNYFTRD